MTLIPVYDRRKCHTFSHLTLSWVGRVSGWGREGEGKVSVLPVMAKEFQNKTLVIPLCIHTRKFILDPPKFWTNYLLNTATLMYKGQENQIGMHNHNLMPKISGITYRLSSLVYIQLKKN